MFNDILNDIWNNYRGRLLCSVFGLFIGVVSCVQHENKNAMTKTSTHRITAQRVRATG